MLRFRYLLLIPLFVAAATPAAGSWLNNPDNSYEVRVATEMGFVGVLKHTIQFGREGTKFDYVADGGQDVLFPFRRMSAELHLKPRHTIILLYQPLDVRTEASRIAPRKLDSTLVLPVTTLPWA